MGNLGKIEGTISPCLENCLAHTLNNFFKAAGCDSKEPRLFNIFANVLLFTEERLLNDPQNPWKSDVKLPLELLLD